MHLKRLKVIENISDTVFEQFAFQVQNKEASEIYHKGHQSH